MNVFTVPAPIVAETLGAFRGARAYFHDIPGNNGDELLRLGSLQVLNEWGIETVSELESCDLVVVRGNGALNDAYVGPVKQILSLAATFRGPLIVLPSSWHMGRHALTQLTTRTAETILFARERPSYEALQRSERGGQVSLALDHDVALGLDLAPLSIDVGQYHDLVALRTDVEQADSSRFLDTARRLYVANTPAPIRRRMRPALAAVYARWLSKDFGFDSGEQGDAPLRVMRGDVSDDASYSFADFCRLIGGSRNVVTSRLHVGILAARLGKSTVLREGNNPKIRGVYEYSLANFTHVHLEAGVDEADGEGGPQA